MNKSFKLNKSYIGILLIALTFPVIIIILDLVNITHIFPLTSKYDWLGFIGAYISGICTLWLGLISIKQNDTLENVNKKMLNNDMISNCFSQIDVESINYLDINFKKEMSYFGIDMINKDSKPNSRLYYFRVILQIKDENRLPLVSAQINKLEIQYKFDDGMTVYDKTSIYEVKATNETKLEVTPNNEVITYYLPINILDNAMDLKQIAQNNKLKITAQIDVKNSFNVISRGEYTILLNQKNRLPNSEWTEYELLARKIYYKDVIYKEESIENDI